MKLLIVNSEAYSTYVALDLDEVYSIKFETEWEGCRVTAYIKNREDDEFTIIYGDYVKDRDSENEAMERDILAFHNAIVDFWGSDKRSAEIHYEFRVSEYCIIVKLKCI